MAIFNDCDGGSQAACEERAYFSLAFDAAQANGPPHDALTAQSDIASVIRTLRALGLELTVKAA